MSELFIRGKVLPANAVGEPGLAESMIPVWGSGRSAVNSFQQGRYWSSAGYTVLAISDVFLVKSLVFGVGKIALRGLSTAAGKQSVKVIEKISAKNLTHAPSLSVGSAEQLVMKVSRSEFTNLGKSFGPGVQLSQVDGWFIKRINPGAGWFRKEWGKISLEAQQAGLTKLGSDMAPEFFVQNGLLFTKSVGKTGPSALQGTFWGGFFKGSYRMGTLLNDIRPRNMGTTGIIFDPAIDPLMKSIFWSTPYGTQNYERIITCFD